jgi:hypothetical protein
VTHIYTCTEEREYIKNSLEKYNNRKNNAYLIVSSLPVEDTNVSQWYKKVLVFCTNNHPSSYKIHGIRQI